MEIEVGKYVRTKNGLLGKVNKIELKGSGTRYAGEFITDTIIQFNDGKVYERRVGDKDIVKHSKHIIDLVEVGDYVNGHKIIMDLKQSRKHYGTIDCFVTAKDYTFEENEIETILTKEQYMQNCYTVERKD